MLTATFSLRAAFSHASAMRSAVARLIVVKSCSFFAVSPLMTNGDGAFCAEAVAASARMTHSNPERWMPFIIILPIRRIGLLNFAPNCGGALVEFRPMSRSKWCLQLLGFVLFTASAFAQLTEQ